MKKGLSTYKYEVSAKSSLIFYGNSSYIIIAGIMVLIGFLAVILHWTVLLSLILLWVILISMGSKNKSITLDVKFLILGGEIIWYRNIENISVHNQAHRLTIITNEKKYTISADGFPTNAHKQDKIKLNKSTKFKKVAEKMIEKVKVVSPQTHILIN